MHRPIANDSGKSILPLESLDRMAIDMIGAEEDCQPTYTLEEIIAETIAKNPKYRRWLANHPEATIDRNACGDLLLRIDCHACQRGECMPYCNGFDVARLDRAIEANLKPWTGKKQTKTPRSR